MSRSVLFANEMAIFSVPHSTYRWSGGPSVRTNSAVLFGR